MKDSRALATVRREVLVETLKVIEKKKGYIQPKDLVEHARDTASPLHKFFEWDDKEGAEKYRVWQARVLIASVKVEIMGKQSDGYYSAVVQIDSEPNRGYVSAERIATDESVQKQVLENALKEIRYWQNKYQELSELSGVVDNTALEALESELTV